MKATSVLRQRALPMICLAALAASAACKGGGGNGVGGAGAGGRGGAPTGAGGAGGTAGAPAGHGGTGMDGKAPAARARATPAAKSAARSYTLRATEDRQLRTAGAVAASCCREMDADLPLPGRHLHEPEPAALGPRIARRSTTPA